MYPFGGGSKSTRDLQGSPHYHSGRGTTPRLPQPPEAYFQEPSRRRVTTESLQTPAPSAGRGSATASQLSIPTHRIDKPSRKGRRRRRYKEDERQVVAAVRRMGACEECHAKKVKCLHRRQTLSSPSQTSTCGEAPRPPTSDFGNLSISTTYPISSSGLSATSNFEEPQQYYPQHGNYSIASFVESQESPTPFSRTITDTPTSWDRRRQVVTGTLDNTNIYFTPETPISRQIDPFPDNLLPILGTFEESTPMQGPRGENHSAGKDAHTFFSDDPTNYANGNPILAIYGPQAGYEPTIASGSQFHKPIGSCIFADQLSPTPGFPSLHNLGDPSPYANYQTSYPQRDPRDVELPQACDSTHSLQPTDINLEGARYSYNDSFTNSQPSIPGAHMQSYAQQESSSQFTNQYYSNSQQQDEAMDEDNYSNSQISHSFGF